MSGGKFCHRLPGEYVQDGMVLGDLHPPDILQRVRDMEYRDGDVLLITYPKTGTTWTQELIWLVCNDADFDKSKSKQILERFPFLELGLSGGPAFLDIINKWDSSVRTLKSHLPVSFFPRVLSDNKQKVVIVVRNPKDTLVSLYHFYRMNASLGNFTGTWDDFFSLFEANHMYMGDFFEWYMGWWQHKDRENVLFIKYEDMKADLRQVIRQVAAFLNKDLTDEVVDKMFDHLQFSSMKANKSTNLESIKALNQEISPFMRKGSVADWKNYFSPAQSALVDKRYRETLEKAGLTLQFE